MTSLFDEKALKKEQPQLNDDDPARFKIVSEIVSSEKRYVEQLNVLNSLYIVPIEASFETEPILTEDQSGVIFNNLTVIKQLNGIFFYKMKERLVSWNKNSHIGDIFIDFVPYFKMYMSYVNNQETAIKVLRQQQKTNLKFINFCKKCDESPFAQNQNLYSFLILPIQRIPRYSLLIKDLIKKTNESHSDFENLTKAHKMLEDVASKIEQEIGDHKNRDLIYSIQESFLDDVVFLEPKRKFIYSATLTKICRNSKKKYTFFLFSDILVYASKSGRKYKLHRKLEINSAFNYQDLTDGEFGDNRIQISTSIKSFEVHCENKQQKQIWIDHFKNVMSEALLRRRKSTVETAPVWKPDVSSKSCNICGLKFSVFRRRHHCRKCGSLICNECSKNRDFLKGLSEDDSVRVCDDCFTNKSQKPPKFRKNESLGLKEFRVVHNYTQKSENELTLKQDDIVVVVHKDKSGWWTGINGNKVGVFPSNYVEPAWNNIHKNKNNNNIGEKKFSPKRWNFEEKNKSPQNTSNYPNFNISKNVLKKTRSTIVRNSLTKHNEMITPKQQTAKPPPIPPKSAKLKKLTSERNINFNTQSLPKNNKNGENEQKNNNKMAYKSKCQTSLKLSNNNTNSITVSASEQYSRATMNELQFGKGEKLQIKYRNKESGWCFGENKATKESGWISEDFISEKHKLDHLDVDKWQFCKCSGFVPNAFRPTLCKECFHNKNSHDEA